MPSFAKDPKLQTVLMWTETVSQFCVLVGLRAAVTSKLLALGIVLSEVL